jgi:ATP-dependent DNA ligase
MTQTYPDIVELVLQAVEGTSLRDFIIDSEIVAFDAITNKIKSF